MVKSIVLTLLSALILTTEAIREIKFDSNNPHTVAIGSDLFTVSLYYRVIAGSNELYLNITSTANNYQNCLVNLDPKLHLVQGRIKARALKDKIIVWGDGKRESSTNYSLVKYNVFLVDPNKCIHTILDNLYDKVPNSYYFVEPEVIVHEDKFDIFYPSQTGCSPCTFDSNGNKIQTTNQIKPEEIKSQFYVRTVGTSHRYVAAYTLLNQSVVLKSFDQNLNTEYTVFLDSDAELIGVANNVVGNEPYVGVIHVSQKNGQKEAMYTVFDNSLNTVFYHYLPTNEDYDFDDAFADIDSLGNSYVTLIEKEKRGPNKDVYVEIYSKRGFRTDEVFFGTRIHMGSMVDRKEQAALVGVREYCLATHVRSGYLNPTETTNIKCVDVQWGA